MGDYESSQRGDLMIAVSAACAVLGAYAWDRTGDSDMLIVGGAAAAVTLAGFYRLTVSLGGGYFRARLGVGLFWRKIAFSRIVSARPVINSWISGWGIRKISGGWMYNVSGFGAVELELSDGGRFRVGTDRPEELAREINSRLGPRQVDSPGSIE